MVGIGNYRDTAGRSELRKGYRSKRVRFNFFLMGDVCPRKRFAAAHVGFGVCSSQNVSEYCCLWNNILLSAELIGSGGREFKNTFNGRLALPLCVPRLWRIPPCSEPVISDLPSKQLGAYLDTPPASSLVPASYAAVARLFGPGMM